MKYNFIGNYGEFITSGIVPKDAYFPLCNENILGAITVDLSGDLKLDQDHFFLPPASRITLTNEKSSVNVWLKFPEGLYSLTGVSSTSLNMKWPIQKRVEAGPGWFKLHLESEKLGLEAVILSFVPPKVQGQFFCITIKSNARKALSFEPIFVCPIYARSADNIRDHRHVTSLLNRVFILKRGLYVKPTMSFDERGHKINDTIYAVLASQRLSRIYSSYEQVIGEGDLLNPTGLLYSLSGSPECLQGKEIVAALVFPETKLSKNEQIEFSCGLFIGKENDISYWRSLCNRTKLRSLFKTTIRSWKDYVDNLKFDFPDTTYSNWLNWVGLQPYLRKVYGCSFLPDFDYGRGGRGWRDLWQDLLGLLLRNPEEVKTQILNNFNGVRIDGSNATIIGKQPGEFIADRNKITRVWMDHGLWPWETVKLYIDQTGDWRILLEEIGYFRDAQIFRARRYDYKWDGDLCLKDSSGQYYKGTVLEHILIQHLVQVLNVGEHGNILLEDADWNDALDMARERGESVAFTHFYAGNLLEIADLLDRIKAQVNSLWFLKEIAYLLEEPVEPFEKRDLLNKYFESVQVRQLSGEKIAVSVDELVAILRRKGENLRSHLLRNELLNIKGKKVFNGYYDNLGRRVCGIVDGKLRVTLTGQVFAIMKSTVDRALAKELACAVDDFLFDRLLGGYRLNTDFGGVYPELGRAFAFAFGEKENGAIFSHMVVMYANALLRQNLVKEAEKVLFSLYELALCSEKSRIFPCLPEYFNNEAKGMYSYLTGSASWYILTLYRELLGISSDMGDLVLYPKLTLKFFGMGEAIVVKTYLYGKAVKFVVKNPKRLDWNEYVIEYVKLGNKKFIANKLPMKISKEEIIKFISSNKRVCNIEVLLGCVG